MNANVEFLNVAPPIAVAARVEYMSLREPSLVSVEPYGSIDEAVAVVRVLFEVGQRPTMRTDDWSASVDDDHNGRLCWSMTFQSRGWKSTAFRIAEDLGVKVRTNGRGWSASDLAFRRFVAAMVRLSDDISARADAMVWDSLHAAE